MSWRSTSALIWICRGELILRLLSIYLVLGIIAERSVISHSSAKGRNGSPRTRGRQSVAQGESASPGYAGTGRRTRVLAGDSDDTVKIRSAAQILGYIRLSTIRCRPRVRGL